MHIDRNNFCCTSGGIAKARAKLTVASDRLDCSPEELESMRYEIADILSRYMNLDNGVFEIRMNIVYGSNRGIQDVKTIQIK